MGGIGTEIKEEFFMVKSKESGEFPEKEKYYDIISDKIKKSLENGSNEFLKSYGHLLNTVEELVYIVDYETREIVFANESFREFFKLRDKPLSGLKCHKVLFGEDDICSFCDDELSEYGEEGFKEYEKQLGSRIFNVKKGIATIFDKKIIVLCARDITENKLLKMRYDDTVDMMTCGYVKCRRDEYWTVEEANSNFYKMIGYTPEEFKELKQNRFSLLLSPGQADDIMRSVDKQLESSSIAKNEYSIIARDGRIVYVVDQISTSVEHGVEYIYTTFFDITERKLAETVIEERYQQELKYMNSMSESVLAFCELNVTKYRVVGWNKGDAIIGDSVNISFDDALPLMFDKHLSPETSRFLRGIFNKEVLLGKYKKGEKKFKLEHYFEFMDDTSAGFWGLITVNLRANPATKDIEAFIYFKDITTDRLLSLAIAKEVAHEYDFIACIDARHNKSVMKDSSTYGRDNVMECHDYEAEVIRYTNTLLIDEDREYLRDRLSLKTVLKELEDKETYEVTGREAVVVGITKYKKYKYSYFDKGKQLILYSQKDITEAVENKDRIVIEELLKLEDDSKVKKLVTDYIARRERFERELLEKAHIDDRTGLFNLNGFCLAVKKLLEENPDKDYYLVVRDINNFKVYNELYGRSKGDELLKYIGQIFRSKIDDLGGVCGYLGADDFVACYSPKSLRMIDDITDFVESSVKQFTSDYKIILCAGIYKITDRKMPVTMMCDRAELALNRAKKANIASCVYDDGIRANLIKTQEVLNEFHNALKEGQFQMYLQPQYNIYTGRIAGAEALARWIHPEKGIVSPADFIPVLEQNGLIPLLDSYIANEACRIMSLLRETFSGDMPPSIAINLSRADIYRPDLIVGLNDTRESYQLPPSALRLEITESLYVEQPKIMASFIDELRGTGYRVEMDDFGSGYSSLNTLKDMDIDMLKLDMKFLSSIYTEKGAKIIKAVVAMANMLEIPMLAEGVETEEQVNFLRSVGCKYVQGYYFSKPIPVEDYINLLMTTEFERIG